MLLTVAFLPEIESALADKLTGVPGIVERIRPIVGKGDLLPSSEAESVILAPAFRMKVVKAAEREWGQKRAAQHRSQVAGLLKAEKSSTRKVFQALDICANANSTFGDTLAAQLNGSLEQSLVRECGGWPGIWLALADVHAGRTADAEETLRLFASQSLSAFSTLQREWILVCKAGIYRATGRYQAALARLKKLLPEAINSRTFLALSSHRIAAEIHSLQGDLIRASSLGQTAVDIAVSLNAERPRLSTLLFLAGLSISKGNLDEARAWHAEAEAVFTYLTKGPRKNKFAFLAHRFAADLVSPREQNLPATAACHGVVMRRREA